MSDLKTRLGAKARRDPNAGRLAGPGQLLTTDVGVVEDGHDGIALGEYALEHGLLPSAQRPTVPAYIRQLWVRRHFMIAYATARNIAMYTEAKLGQVWQVLTPLLNAGVYYLIFGELFQTSRAVNHFPAFLLLGVFVFAFTERSIVTGSNVMRANLQLIRALYFPRASLPLAYVIVELQQMLIGMVVVVIAMLASEQWPSWYWLMLIPIGVLQTMFNTGAALIVARLGGAMADVSELIPFILRISRYFCGVMYLTYTLTYNRPDWIQRVLSLNPFAVYISLFRVAFMTTYRQDSPGNAPFNQAMCNTFLANQGHYIPGTTTRNYSWLASCHAIVTNNDLWIAAVGWGVALFAIGIVFFWRAEHLYGRG